MLCILGMILSRRSSTRFGKRELKQRRRRRRGQPLVENELIFYQRNSRYANGSKIVVRLIVQFQMETPKISRGRPHSVDEAELSHFKLLFCKGRQKMFKDL